MSDEIDDLLAGSDSEDDDDTEEDVADNRPRGNDAIKQIREAEQRATKRAEKAQRRVQELESKLAEYATKEKVSSLQAAGFNEKQAKVFLKSYDEVTPDAITEFKAEVLGITQDAGESETPSPGFAPTQGEVEPASKGYSKADFERIMRENPAKGWQILNSGKVQF